MQDELALPFLKDDEYRDLRRRLVRYFASRARHCAAELADETLMRALQSNGRRAAGCSVDRWAFGIAKKVLLEARRVGSRTVPLNPALPPPPALRCASNFSFAELETVPLTAAERRLLQARYVEGHTATDVARDSGISASGVRGQTFRVIQKLRLHFGVEP